MQPSKQTTKLRGFSEANINLFVSERQRGVWRPYENYFSLRSHAFTCFPILRSDIGIFRDSNYF